MTFAELSGRCNGEISGEGVAVLFGVDDEDISIIVGVVVNTLWCDESF
jgi:hypothetical protein